MKKVLFLSLVFGGLALTSCKKDYTCECTYDLLGVQTSTSVEFKDVKKKEAEDACNSYNLPNASDMKCSLK